ncbi:MAG: hypothetical protein ACE5DM_02110 [Candidatus Nanoarchaeia archaeon]
MEYLTIVGFVAAIVIPMTMIYITYSDQSEDQIISNQVFTIATRIGDTAETVYYLGEPSKTTLRAYFPKNINNITIGNYEIVFFVRTKNGIDEVVVSMPVNVSGSLSQTSGIHNIKIEAQGDAVQISD